MGYIGRDSELRGLNLEPLDLEAAPVPELTSAPESVQEPASAPALSVQEPALPA